MVDNKINTQEKLNRLKEIRKQLYDNSKQGVMVFNKVEFLGEGKKTHKELYRVIERFMVDNKTEDRELFYEFENDEFDLIAYKRYDNKIIPTPDFIKKGEIVDGEWKSPLRDDIEERAKERDDKLNAVLEKLGLEEEAIYSISEIELNQKIKEKDKEDKDKEEKDKEKDENESQEISEEKVKSSQIGLNEVSLNAKVDTKGTELKDVLKLDGYTKLLVVHSYKLSELTDADGKSGKNSISKYSLIAQKADGTYETIPNSKLERDRGNNSNIFEINNKDEVERNNVEDRFRVPGTDDSLVIDPKDPYNIPNVYLSKNTPDNNGQLAQKLQDKYDGEERTDVEVRAIFNANRGEYMSKEAVNEAKEHTDAGCEKIGHKEANGDPNDGHIHINFEDPNQQKAIEEIIEKSGSGPDSRISEKGARELFTRHFEDKNNTKEGQARIDDAKEKAIEDIYVQTQGSRGGNQ